MVKKKKKAKRLVWAGPSLLYDAHVATVLSLQHKLIPWNTQILNIDSLSVIHFYNETLK